MEVCLKSVLNTDGSIAIISDLWSETITQDQLPGRIKFYTGLRDRHNGRYAKFYRETVAGLERVAREIRSVDRAAQDQRSQDL